MTRDELKPALVAEAERLGFNSCRVARCDVPEHAPEFRQWVNEGAAGEMQWLERGAAKRADPQQVLWGARSVLVLALNYWQGGAMEPARPRAGRTEIRLEGQPAPQTYGRIARYALGDDYHDVVTPKLRQLDAFLQEHGGVQKCYVDTGPILERDFAAAAGIGWHGKSTMLVDQKLGTWFFLAEILTTLELPIDEPQTARCGSCTRCVNACPTGAITPHRLDARRCISYLTIELKGAIPLELRPLIGDRIYGCDDCLEACPWNRFAVASRESSFAARDAVKMPLRDYLALDDEHFRVLFRGSAIKRVKRCGFLRNVCVALGNIGDERDLSALERAAADPEPLIAEHATWAIEQITSRIRWAAGRHRINQMQPAAA